MAFSDLLAARRPILGTWSQIASAEVIDIVAASGFAFTIIDTEHGFFGLETAENLIRACDAGGIVPLVRVPANEPWMIAKALDAGASAVVVPRIESGEAAAAAVQAGRYEPEGQRGACPCVRSGSHFVRGWPDYATRANRDTGVIALVETPAGVERFAEILATPGLRAVLIGPFDLSVALGRQGDFLHPEVLNAIEGMVEQAVAADMPVIMPVFSPEMEEAKRQVDQWMARGVTAFTIGTDKLLLADHAMRYTARMKGEMAEARGEEAAVS